MVSQLIKAGMDDVIFKPVLRNSFLSRLEISPNLPSSPLFSPLSPSLPLTLSLFLDLHYIWRPKLTDAFAWTHIVDNALLDELALSAPSTISEAIPRIIELSMRVSSLTVNAFGGEQESRGERGGERREERRGETGEETNFVNSSANSPTDTPSQRAH